MSESCKTPRPNQYGDIKKCPACGGLITSFTAKCTECGYEFKNIESNVSVKKLFEILNEIEANSSDDSLMGGIRKVFTSALGGDGSIRKKRTIIQNFPIPNTKEDLLEFLSLAVPNAKSTWRSDTDEVEMAKVWKKKCEQIIIKAKMLMPDDQKTLEQIAAYAKQLKIKS